MGSSAYPGNSFGYFLHRFRAFTQRTNEFMKVEIKSAATLKEEESETTLR
jgi:hypothetical protein